MTIAAVKEQLHEYIEHADAQKVNAMLAFVKSELLAKEYVFDEETINMLQERLEEYLSGGKKGYTMEESIARAEKFISKK